MSGFDDLNLMPELHAFLKENGFKKPTEVQAKSIGPLLEGNCLSVLAQTGTGKTLAYALPLVQRLKETEEEVEQILSAPRAVIISPTRELSSQIQKVFKSITHHAKLKVRVLSGGDKGASNRSIRKDWLDILIVSPSRFLKSLENGEIKHELIETLILDEADQLLDLGFSKDLEKIHKILKNPDLQVGLFSATRPEVYDEFVKKVFMGRKFKDVTCQGVHGIKQNIETFNIYLGLKEKDQMTQALLEKECKGRGIIFLNKKESVDKLYQVLKEKFPRRRFWVLHGELSRKERKEAHKNFSEKGGVLVASDVAARGLDIEDLNWVLNYDLPFEAVYYIHRCGRTGRGKKKGVVYNFATSMDVSLIQRINEAVAGQSSLKLKLIDPPKRAAKKKVSKKAASKKVTKKVAKKAVKRSKRTPRYKRK